MSSVCFLGTFPWGTLKNRWGGIWCGCRRFWGRRWWQTKNPCPSKWLLPSSACNISLWFLNVSSDFELHFVHCWFNHKYSVVCDRKYLREYVKWKMRMRSLYHSVRQVYCMKIYWCQMERMRITVKRKKVTIHSRVSRMFHTIPWCFDNLNQTLNHLGKLQQSVFNPDL